MIITYTHEIPMGHRLMNHQGRCKFLHGHNYLVEVGFRGDVKLTKEWPDYGMVMDFAVLKKAVRRVLDIYDHAFALQAGDPAVEAISDFAEVRLFDLPPTAEVLASVWGIAIANELQLTYDHIWCTVHETRDTRVIWTPELT